MKRQQLPRFLQQAIKNREAKSQAADGMNRAGFRAGGLQGRRFSLLVPKKVSILAHILERESEQQWVGRKRGGFLTPGGRSAILIPYATSKRRSLKMLRRAVGAQEREQRQAIKQKQQDLLTWQDQYKEDQDAE